MKITFSELKLRARRSLYGNFGSLAGLQILLLVVSFVLQPAMYVILIPAFLTVLLAGVVLNGPLAVLFLTVGIVAFCFAIAAASLLLGVGFSKIHLELAQARPFVFGHIFYAFSHGPWKFIGASALLFGLGALTSIPGVLYDVVFWGRSGPVGLRLLLMTAQYVLLLWLTSSFVLFPYRLIEQPEKKVLQCMRESHEMMKGNRIRYLLLCLSFFGWYLLAGLSAGIGALWVFPYVMCTLSHFYLDLRERRRLEQAGCCRSPETKEQRYEE